ncbi:MAG: DUF3078 domain-containing protein [Bacteroidaceae bacterium]|nr:DUF3078 domain-containing protein [Bacteroidaceae bacterium]
MKCLSRLFLICLVTLFATSATKAMADVKHKSEQNEATPDTSQVLKNYLEALNSLVKERDSLSAEVPTIAPNAYYYQMFSSPALYSASLHQAMGQTDTSNPDLQLQRIFASRKMLSMLYGRAPQLVTHTESDILGQAAIRSDINDMLQTSDKLADKVAAATLLPEVDGEVKVITRRPNFWKFSGTSSLQFAQNYISDNWYKGGETNWIGNFDLTLRANYNDQRKITWENTLDAQLGFQTTETDKNRTFRPSHNLLRYTTNAGYKAWKNWYYSLLVILQTQIAPNYQKNTDDITSKILSPLEVTVAPSMKYEIKWGKKQQFTGQLNVAPLAMKVLYVHDDDLVTNFGLPKGKHQKTTFGPNITLNTTWKICKQITWINRMYWFSNFDYHIWEWENKIDFTVTKLITANLHLYPRFDNSNPNYRSGEQHDGTYLMFKELLSLGLTYNF